MKKSNGFSEIGSLVINKIATALIDIKVLGSTYPIVKAGTLCTVSFEFNKEWDNGGLRTYIYFGIGESCCLGYTDAKTYYDCFNEGC